MWVCGSVEERRQLFCRDKHSVASVASVATELLRKRMQLFLSRQASCSVASVASVATEWDEKCLERK